MNYRFELAKQPQKYLKKLPRDKANYILDNIDAIRCNPKHSPNIKRLKGEWKGFYRLRVGGYRVIYSIPQKILAYLRKQIEFA